jgi:hypothetical protein
MAAAAFPKLHDEGRIASPRGFQPAGPGGQAYRRMQTLRAPILLPTPLKVVVEKALAPLGLLPIVRISPTIGRGPSVTTVAMWKGLSSHPSAMNLLRGVSSHMAAYQTCLIF